MWCGANPGRWSSTSGAGNGQCAGRMAGCCRWSAAGALLIRIGMAVFMTLRWHARLWCHSQLSSLDGGTLVVERWSSCVPRLSSSSSVAVLAASPDSESGHVVLYDGVRSCSSSSGAVGVGCVVRMWGSSTGRQFRILLSHSGVVLGTCSLVKVGRAGIVGRFPGSASSAARLLRLAISSAASLV